VHYGINLGNSLASQEIQYVIPGSRRTSRLTDRNTIRDGFSFPSSHTGYRTFGFAPFTQNISVASLPRLTAVACTPRSANAICHRIQAGTVNIMLFLLLKIPDSKFFTKADPEA